MKLLRLRKSNPRRVDEVPDNGASSAMRRRGQSLVEFAMVLPILIVLLSVVVEGGLALNTWMRVNTAARDATRFRLDSGRPSETANLVLDKLAGIELSADHDITGSTHLDVYIITATTSITGQISSWQTSHAYDGNGNNSTPKVTQATIQARLNSQGFSVSQSITAYIVEVDFDYTPLLATLVTPGAYIHMSSYAMVQY